MFKFLVWLLCAGALVLVSPVQSRTLAGNAQELDTTLRLRRDLGGFCGVEHYISNRRRRDAPVYRWPTGANLTYRVGSGPTRGVLKDADINGIVKLAFREWAPHCGLNFTQIHSGKANITISFEGGATHLNCPALDPPDVLAHSDFPTNKTRNVQVCFDDQWDWTLFYVPGSIQFYSTLLRELGHALGLLHSGTYHSVMFSSYSPFDYGVAKINLEASTLQNEDISRMRELYGIADTYSDPIFSGHSFKPFLYTIFTSDVNIRNKLEDHVRKHLGFSNNTTGESYTEASSTVSSERPISRTNATRESLDHQLWKGIYDIIKR